MDAPQHPIGTISNRLGSADIRTTMNIYSYALHSADNWSQIHSTRFFPKGEKNGEIP